MKIPIVKIKENSMMQEDTKEKRMEEVKQFTKRVLEKFNGLIKAIVIIGSVVRGEFKPESDIDVFIIIDDTLEEISPEKQEEIDDEIEKIAKSVSEKLSVQPSYTLTEFTDYARSGHPIVYNFIKEGIAVYDTGFFMPWKRLLVSGKIPRTREAVKSYMESASQKITRAKTVKLLMLAEDCYYAMLNSAQAVLMFMDLEPPIPSKAYEEIKEHLVEPGILKPEYAEWLKGIIEIRKNIEHKKLLEVSGAFVDEWIEKAEKFVNMMLVLLDALELIKKEKILIRIHETMLMAVATALKFLHKLPEETTIEELEKKLGMSLIQAFEKELISTGKIKRYYLDLWKQIENLKKEVIDEKDLGKKDEKLKNLKSDEVYQLRDAVREFIDEIRKLKVDEKS